MKITVIIPVYNKIKYLETVLRQVREQSFTDFECLLIDDGSRDGSGAVCDSFAAADSRFKVFHIPNGGVSNARNIGLNAAKGEYVTFIDADDQIHSDFLQKLLQGALESGASFVIGNLRKFWEDCDRTEDLAIPYDGLQSMETLLPEFARVQRETGIFGFCVAKLIRRDLIGEERFDPKIRLAEDLDFYLRLYPKIESIYFEAAPYYYYLQAAENSSMLEDDSKIDYFTQLTIQQKIVRFLQKKESFSGENEAVMILRLYDYVFFTLFHCDPRKIRSLSREIKKLGLPPMGNINGGNRIRKTLLFFYNRNLHGANAVVMQLYRTARKCARKSGKVG